MLNKYLHSISFTERNEVVGLGKERPRKTPASNNLLLSVSLSKRWGHLSLSALRGLSL